MTVWQWVAFGAVALLGIVVAAVLFLSAPDDAAVRGAAAGAVLATVAAAVTTAYVFLTHRIAEASVTTAQEAKAQRESGLRPVLVFDLALGAPLSDPRVPMLVKNFGPGPALQVHVQLGFAAGARRDPLGVTMALPADHAVDWRVYYSGPRVAAALTGDEKCILSAVYDDVFGTCWGDPRTAPPPPRDEGRCGGGAAGHRAPGGAP